MCTLAVRQDSQLCQKNLNVLSTSVLALPAHQQIQVYFKLQTFETNLVFLVLAHQQIQVNFDVNMQYEVITDISNIQGHQYQYRG